MMSGIGSIGVLSHVQLGKIRVIVGEFTAVVTEGSMRRMEATFGWWCFSKRCNSDGELTQSPIEVVSTKLFARAISSYAPAMADALPHFRLYSTTSRMKALEGY